MTRRRRPALRGHPGAEPSVPASAPPTPRVRVGGPGDLLAMVPYLLGFHPAESIVTVFIRGGQVALTARMDLPARSHALLLARELTRLADQHHADELVLIIYSAEAVARGFLTDLVEASTKRLSDALLVDGERWWSLLCEGDCCPPEGRPYEMSFHRLAAEAVYAGMSVRRDRGELAELVSGPSTNDLDRLTLMADDAAAELAALTRQERAQRLEATVRSAVAGADLDDAQLLQLAALVTDVLLRDRAWALISRVDAREHVQLWTSVVAVSPPRLARAPLCLLGLAAWISGDGALQNCCVERVQRIDPHYSLGVLLGDISARALAPTLWDELQVEMRAELGPLAGWPRLH